MKFLSDILAKAGLTVDGVVTLNNTATGQTPDANDNSTKLATTAWVRGFVTPYSLPIASGVTLGGIKIGSGLAIDGTGIVSVTTSGVASVKSTQTFTATAAQTVFTISGGYTPGLIDVFLNGVYLSPNQTTATNGTTVTLGDAASAGDIIDVIITSPIYQGSVITTDQLPEGTTNLYYTNARARAAVSLTTTGVSGVATYNSSTGVFNIPNYQGLVPSGGTTGQILTKSSSTDYDSAWIENYADWTAVLKHRVKAGEAITKGQAVYVSSADGTNMIVSKASNATEGTSSKTMGLLESTVSTNGFTNVITEGLLGGLNTATATAGDPVWLGTGGNLIYGLLNKPYAPAHLVFIGIVTRVNSNNGEIFVKVQNGFELEELHDLSVKNASDGDMIKYVASTGLWTKIAATTTNITEGTNLYYTNTRARLAISLTTTGTSGAASYDNATGILNIPQYQGGVTSFNTRTGAITLSSTDVTTALTYTPVTNARTLTINGTTYDLSADRTWSIAAGLTSFNTRTGDITLTSSDVTTALGYTPVTNARTLTINGTAYDLTADRTWTIGVTPSARTIQTYTATAAQTTFTVTGGYVVGLVDVFINGVRLTSADFTASNGTTVVLTTGTGVNNIVDVIKYTSAFTATNALRQVTNFIATAGQTSFTVSYTPGLIDVFYNGSKLAASEYTASNGTTVVLANAAVLNDLLEIISYSYTVGSYSGQTQLNGTGLVRMSGTTVTYDNATYATQSYVTTAVANLVNSAPSTLDTLNELATALGNDANFATTITTSIATKQPQLNGTGFVKISGTTISYDNSTYLTSASLTGYVPYSGATGAVNLGNYNLTIKEIVIGTGAKNNTNIAIGRNVMSYSSGGTGNVAIGVDALYFDQSDGSVVIGYEAGYYSNQGRNVTIGYQAGRGNGPGSNSIAVGYQALTANTNGSNNIALGYLAGSELVGSNNTIIGGYLGTTMSSNVVIADGAGNIRFQWDGSNIKLNGNTVGSNAYTSTAYLPLAGGTLTGALSGTSATFSSTIQSTGLTLLGPTGAGTGPSLTWDRSGGYGSFAATYIYENTYYTGGSTLEFKGGTLPVFRMVTNNAYTVAQVHFLGAATFSSSVSAGDFVRGTCTTAANGDGIRAIASATGGGGSQPGIGYWTAAGSKRFINQLDVSSDTWALTNATGVNLLLAQQTGALTLTSSTYGFPLTIIGQNTGYGSSILLDSGTAAGGKKYSVMSSGSANGAIAGNKFAIYNLTDDNYPFIINSNAVTHPLQPAFKAGLSSSTSFGTNSTIIFNDVSGNHFNIGGCYSTSTGIFTAPVAGRYIFSTCIIYQSMAAGQQMDDAFYIYKNSTLVAYSFRRAEYEAGYTGNSGYYVDHANTLLNLAAGDTVSIRNNRALDIHGNTNYCFFYGYMLG